MHPMLFGIAPTSNVQKHIASILRFDMEKTALLFQHLSKPDKPTEKRPFHTMHKHSLAERTAHTTSLRMSHFSLQSTSH